MPMLPISTRLRHHSPLALNVKSRLRQARARFRIFTAFINSLLNASSIWRGYVRPMVSASSGESVAILIMISGGSIFDEFLCIRSRTPEKIFSLGRPIFGGCPQDSNTDLLQRTITHIGNEFAHPVEQFLAGLRIRHIGLFDVEQEILQVLR